MKRLTVEIAKFGLCVAIVGMLFTSKRAEADAPSLSALTAQGCEVRAAYHSTPFDVIILQRGKDVFQCNFANNFKGGSSGCFSIK